LKLPNFLKPGTPNDEIAERTDLEVLSDARAMRFDRDGNLPPFTF